METQHITLPSIAKGNGGVLKDLFRDLVFNGIYQGTTWQLHRYGINCKLSGAVFAINRYQGCTSTHTRIFRFTERKRNWEGVGHW